MNSITFPFITQKGEWIPNLTIAYHCYGTLNANKNNVVWLIHPLTASSDIKEWWPNFLEENKLPFFADKFVICANYPSSCYGSSNPLSSNIKGEKYFNSFPIFSPLDMVNSYRELACHLGIDNIYCLLGASFGGQQALQWAVTYPNEIQNLVLIACNAKQSSWALALSKTQQMAIESDSTWNLPIENAGESGLATARAIAILSYRNYQYYEQKQNDEQKDICQRNAASFQEYQGLKFRNRFSAICYWYLCKSMDQHNVAVGFNSLQEALSRVVAKTLVIGIKSDLLFPIVEQEFLAQNIQNSTFKTFDSIYGHDGFLLEEHKVFSILNQFFNPVLC